MDPQRRIARYASNGRRVFGAWFQMVYFARGYMIVVASLPVRLWVPVAS